MKYAVFFLSLFFVLSGFSQPVQSSTMFDKTWGLQAPNFIAFADETAEGDFILIGHRQETQTQNGGLDFYVCKLDYQGSILWEKDIGYPYEIEQTMYVIKTREETYLLAGVVSQLSLTRLINLDKGGNILFDVVLSNSPGLSSTPFDVSQATDGGFFIGGVQANNQIHYNTIIKVDAQGNEQWRQLNTDRAYFRLREIEATPDGGCLVAGIANGTYNYNTFIERLDADGNVLWYQYPYGVNDTIWNYPIETFVFPDGSFNTYCAQPSTDPAQNYSKLFKFRTDEQLYDTLTHPFAIQFPYRGKAQIDSRTGSYVISNNPHPYINNYLSFIDPQGAVGAIVKYSEVYLPYTSFYYALRTKDGGFLAVGERNSQFWAVKFASDLRYQHSILSETIQAYPNPTNTGIVNLVFDLETDENLELEIWSVDGKLILQDRFFCPAHSLNTYPVRFDLAGAGAGMYMLKVRSSSTTYFQKLIVDD